MKPGKCPTPTGILKARGSWRGDLRKGEPKPDLNAVQCPTELQTDYERQLWYDLQAKLVNQGIFDSSNRIALSRYIQVCARWYDLSSTGLLSEEKMAKLAPILDRLEGKFGLTPSDRTRVRSENETPDKNSGKLRFFKPA
jgi:hypothetical protein